MAGELGSIQVSEASKSFKLPHEKHGTLKSVILNIFRAHKTFEVQKALTSVSFDVKPGEFFGIIGRNGGGKSTLLKLLAGIYSTDSGAITVNGKLTPFIELGVGFNPELTGRDNVFLNGALLGFNQKEMEAMYDDIVAFAELEKFMDQKLKNYSSGMQVRLAFSIAIRAKSDILLIDEVLAVGDTNFQKKCIGVFEELKRSGTTIVFVSHSMGYVRDFCDRVAVISKGNVVFVGDTEKGVDIYNKLNLDEEIAKSEIDNKKSSDEAERLGNGDAKITDWTFYDEKNTKTSKLASGKKFSIKLGIAFENTVTNPAIGIMFRKNQHDNLFGINNYYQKKNFGKYKKGDKLQVKVEGTLPLVPGSYYVTFSVVDARTSSDYIDLDTLNNVLKINVSGEESWGLIASDAKMEIDK